MSLRLRSTKTELQEIGEDAEGAAENISKLREQILGLTGVDIQLDESTYKSTYQILLEISKVWGKLDDLSRSSVLEQLFGKRQANIGAAILENGELLQRVYESAEQSAGSAMKEQLEYAKSIQYSIDTVKAAFQDFSQTAINSEFIRGILQMAKSLLEWLDRIVDKIGLLPPILAVIGAYLGAKKGIAILSFIKSLYTGLVGLITATNSAAIATKALSTAWKVLGNVLVAAAISGVIWALDKLIVTQREAEEEFNNMVDEAYQSTEKYKEEAKELDSLTQKYIDIKNSTADITTKKEQLTSLQEQLVKSYGKEAGGIDLVNGSLEENIKLLNERRKLNAEDYISKNKGKYEEAVENLGYGYYRVGKNLPNEFRRELEEIANRFDNYNAATGQIEGSFEERLETLKKIRDIYSEQEGHNSKWLSQLEGQIDEYKNIYDLLTNIVDESKKAQEIASITPQQQNIITQATEAYKAYQEALEEGNKAEARNARSALEGIKEVMYSITEPTSVLRQDFDEMWAGFNLGSETALSRIAQVKNDFDELSDNFSKSLKNVEKINSAIESMLSGEYLSHDDAWELLKYDTDGVLKDIEIVNGKYKFDTEQLMALMRQKIDLQKTSIQAIKDQAEAERTLLNSQLLRLTTSINSASDYRIYKQKISDINGELKDTENIIDKCGYLLEELNVELGRAEVLTSSTAKQLSATIAAYEDEIKAIEDTIDSLKDRKDILEDEKKQLQEQLEILNKQKEVLEETLKNYDAVADAVADYVKIQTDSIQKQIDALKEQKKLIEDSYDERIKALKAENDERDLALRKEQALIDLANAENQKKKVWSSDRGIEWGTSADDVAKARKTLADIEAEELINALEKEKEEALKGFDEKEKAYESQIKTFEEYAKKYTDVASDIQKAENEMLADQILGSNWREEVIKEATDNLGVQLNAEQKEIVDDYKAIMQEINDYNVDLNKTVFGNIDTNQRQVLEWNDENLSKFANSIESWGETAEDLRDTVSTVFGVWDTFDGVDIAFSPMLQTPNGAVLLDADTVWDYIYGLIDKAGEGWTSEMLFKLDTEGLKVDGVEVKNLIADIGETAEETSRTMHYVGTDGAYALVCREVENVAKTLDVGIEKVLDTNKALVGNSKMLITYTNNYKNFNSQLKNLVNNEIASLNASIEAKDKEINKIQDEIDAYNKYKDTVKTSLDNAKTEFENYKNTLDRVVPLINEAHEKMEGATWDRHNKVKDYYKEMAEAAESARDRICTANANIQAALEGMRSNSAVLAGVALIGGIVGSHAEGGVNSSTGLAMLHGTKQRSETIFNANDSKKLYDFIHTTPNLIAASMKQATKIAGVNPSNITNNSNANNINVSIGQVVANNPQEFTRNLDTHIDSYFKRKLTEGYVR